MIVVRKMGGKGNVLWQTAYGMALQHRGYEVRYDDNKVTDYWHGPKVYENGMLFDAKHLTPEDPSLRIGYWQNLRYLEGIEDKVREEFVPKGNFHHTVADLWFQIMGSNSVMVHVRRGDYMLEPHKSYHGTLTYDNYYKAALDYIRERVQDARFFFFSDEPQWVRDNFYTDFSLGAWQVVETGSVEADLYLMSYCKHAIIANSSFSFWGAFLGADKTGGYVAAPKNWFQANVPNEIVPDRWHKA